MLSKTDFKKFYQEMNKKLSNPSWKNVTYKLMDDYDDWFGGTLYITDREDDYFADARQLTKKHEFDFEMIYKPILVQNGAINQDTKLTLRLIDDLINDGNLYRNLKEKTNDFLDTYNDIIDWYKLLVNNENHVKINIFQITEKFKSHFDEKCWTRITSYCYDHKNPSQYRRRFIRKYKDNLDWNYLSSSDIDFDLDFIMEMKEYFDIDVLLKKPVKHIKLMNQLLLYTKNHLEEVLTYKEEDKNGR